MATTQQTGHRLGAGAGGSALTRRGMLIFAAVVVFASVLVIAVIAIDQMRDSAQRSGGTAATLPSGISSPYDMAELRGELDLNRLMDTSFVSILVLDSGGRLTSYMTDADGTAAKALIEAVRSSKQVEPADLSASAETNAPATVAQGAAATGLVPTLTFVLPSRQTVTFTLDLRHGLLFRESGAWRPEGDLRALISAATTAPAVPQTR